MKDFGSEFQVFVEVAIDKISWFVDAATCVYLRVVMWIMCLGGIHHIGALIRHGVRQKGVREIEELDARG